MSGAGTDILQQKQRRTALVLVGVAVGMLCLGFSAKLMYNTFCRVTGYGGTTQVAERNDSQVIDREITVSFDSNVAPDLPWSFTPEQRNMSVKVGQSALAYYKVSNLSDQPLVGTATYNVTPIKTGPFFIKTECFCFTEQRIEPGQSVSMPVLFYIDPLIDEERRLEDVSAITLSYTFFKVDNPKYAVGAQKNQGEGANALN